MHRLAAIPGVEVTALCDIVQRKIDEKQKGMTDRGYPNQVSNFIQQTSGTLTINGGYFDGTNCALQVVNGSKAVINGGTFYCKVSPGTVRLRFRLRGGARLYSFWFSDKSGVSRGYLGGGGPDYPGLRDVLCAYRECLQKE